MVVELYDALRKAGVDEATAQGAARAVSPMEQTATKADLAALRADLHALEAALVWKLGTLIITAMVALTGIFAAIVRLG
jgi:hypothetical protein